MGVFEWIILLLYSPELLESHRFSDGLFVYFLIIC